MDTTEPLPSPLTTGDEPGPDRSNDDAERARPTEEDTWEGPLALPAGSSPLASPRRPRELLRRAWSTVARSDVRLYLIAMVITAGCLTWMSRLWQATLSVPFNYTGDAVGSAAYFKDVLQVGWYENQPNLGAPYGQHYHDFPFTDDLNPAMGKVLSLFTDDWAVAMNLYYLLGFLLCAATAVWFFRVCGLGPWFSVVLSVLFALAPYHFLRGETHLFLASYYCVPLAMVVVLRLGRGESIWRIRLDSALNRPLRLLTGRGAGTALILLLVVYSGAYYGLFTAFLLLFAGAFALLRRWQLRRLLETLTGGATLLAAFVLALLPDIRYLVANGPNPGAVVRGPAAAESVALKFAELLLPSPGHPIPAFASFRAYYDRVYPLPSENPVLGFVAALGFLVLVGAAFGALTGRFQVAAARATPAGRRNTILTVSFLACAAFGIGTIGGLGTFVSFFAGAIRGYNRISILISLFALAGVGLALEAVGDRIRRSSALRAAIPERRPRRRPSSQLAGVATPVFAVLVLAVGVADQSIASAHPHYNVIKASFEADQAYVDRLQATLPAGSMIFVLPWQPFPESDPANGVPESDQLKLWLHSTSLRWSGGGIKGRPQVDWPGTVVKLPPAQMVKDLAAIGFTGISIHRQALADHGREWESDLLPLLGPPTIVSRDQQYSYLPLATAITELHASTTPEQRAELAAGITHMPIG